MFTKRLLIASFLAPACMIFAAEPAPTDRTISLEDCIKLALEKNLDLRIERISPLIAQLSLEASKGVYDPSLGFAVRQTFSSAEVGGINPTTGLPNPPRQDYNESFGGGQGSVLSGKTYFGGTVDLTGTMNRLSGLTRVGGFQYSSSVSIQLTQPFLRNFLIDGDRYNIQVNRNNIRTTELQLRLQVMSVVTRVEQAYYDLIFSRENVKVQEQALGLSDRFLSETKTRIQVGTLAQLDEKQAESQVAANKATLLSAQQTLDARQNVMKGLISDDFIAWNNVNLIPASGMSAVPTQFDLMESLHKGLTLRPEILQQKISLESRNIQLKYLKNQTLPQLDMSGGYGYGGLGASVGGAFADIRDQNTPSYNVGVNFRIPIGNHVAKSNYRSTQEQLQQDILRLKQSEQVIMFQIKDAIKLAQTSFERVDATRQARIYAEAALDAEQKKLENGKSTSFLVLQAQRDVTARRSEEIGALADYNKSLSQLSQDEATTLERNKINLEVK